MRSRAGTPDAVTQDLLRRQTAEYLKLFRAWFFNGNWRMRCAVASKIALSTAGADTKIVGSRRLPRGSLRPKIDEPKHPFSELYTADPVLATAPSSR